VDWNSDGLIDLLCGESDGTVHLYINVGSAGSPLLTDAGLLQVGGSTLTVGSYSMPYVVNWNHDRPLDLIVGSSDGTVRLFINDGTSTNPHFSAEQYVLDGGAHLDVGSRASPCAADMNGDGLFDLVVGTYDGTLLFYRNQGVLGLPAFSGSSLLGVTGEPIETSYTSRPDAVDWNEDGLIDILSGSYVCIPQLYLGSGDKVHVPELDVFYAGWYVPPGGGTVSFEVTVVNPHDTAITADLYVAVQCAQVGFWGPVKNFQNVTLGPGQQIQATLNQYIPGVAPMGSYMFTVFLGDSATWTFTNMDYFYTYKM